MHLETFLARSLLSEYFPSSACTQLEAPRALVVTILASSQQDLTPMHTKGLSLHVVFMLLPMLYGSGRAEHHRILHEAAKLVDAGKLNPLIDEQIFSFAEAGAAHRKLEAGNALGKIVLKR